MTADELAGSVALITGAGRGLGRALSLRLAGLGVVVGLLSRSPEPLAELADEITRAGGRALALPADVADEAAVERAVARLVAFAGGLDIVVHCAGVGIYGPVERYRLADWQRTFATNVTGLFLCARAALPHLTARGGGQIVAVSSGAARRGYAGLAAYAASKFAVQGFMESLAEEVAASGIKCGTILPGSILTEFGPTPLAEKQARQERGERSYLQPDDVAEAIVQMLRQPRHAWLQQINLWPF